MKKLVLIDGHALAYRAFYALPTSMKNHTGQSTNVIVGFTRMLIRIIYQYQPASLAIAFDTAKPTFRHKQYTDYKAHRPPSPPEFHTQIPILQELLQVLGIGVIYKDGFEADDIVATIAQQAERKNFIVNIITGDKDILQLVNKNISVHIPKKGLSNIKIYNLDNFKEQTGLYPHQIVDYKSLRGDASDNIKGIPGIGEKTAIKLLQEYNSLETLLKECPYSKMNPSLKEKILDSKELLSRNQELTTLYKEVPIERENIDEFYNFIALDFNKARYLLEKLGIKSFLKTSNSFEKEDKIQHNNKQAPLLEDTTYQGEQQSFSLFS